MIQKKLFFIIVVFGLLFSGGFSAGSGEGPWKFYGCCSIQGYKECWGPTYFPDQASCLRLYDKGVAQCQAGAAEYRARYSITGGCTYDEEYDKTKCLNSCASFYVCSWENGQCIKRIRSEYNNDNQPFKTPNSNNFSYPDSQTMYDLVLNCLKENSANCSNTNSFTINPYNIPGARELMMKYDKLLEEGYNTCNSGDSVACVYWKQKVKEADELRSAYGKASKDFEDQQKCLDNCPEYYVCTFEENSGGCKQVPTEDFWHSGEAFKEMHKCIDNCPEGYVCVYGKSYNGCGRIPKSQFEENDAKQKCLASCASFYVCSWENGQCIKRIASQEEQEQQIAQAQQIIGSAIDDWVGQAVQLPAGKISDENGNSVSADTFKQEGIGESLPKINVEYNIKNGKAGDDVSATLPEGATVTRITTTLKQPTDDATMDVSVIYGKDWQNYRGANGAPDYPSVNGEQVDKMLVVNTKNNDQPYEDYSQALIEFSTTRHSYAYSESDSKVTADQLKNQQDFFKYLETKSNAAQYKPQGYSWDSFTKLLFGKQASDAANAKGVAVAIYDENKKSWEKLPSWKISCEGNICRYAALSPHLSTFAIVLIPQQNFAFAPLFSLIILIVALIEIAAVIFLNWFLKKREDKKNKSKAKGNASLVLGILSILFCIAPYVGLFLAGLATVLSKAQKRTNPTKIATAGLILGIIGLCLNICVFITMMAFFLFI